MNIPKGHQTVMPYMIINGAEKFKGFLEKVFNAKETFYLADENRGVRHAEMQINGSTVMFADNTEQWHPQPSSMYLYVENADDTYQKALANGATSLMEPSDQDYGRSCGVKDEFGNVWWITTVV